VLRQTGTAVLVAGLAPEFGIGSVVLATAAFVVSWQKRSFLIAGLLGASGIIFMIPAVTALGDFSVIVFPGPILGVVFGLVVFGLGVAKGIGTARIVTVASR
jgi:hypothetical protein